MFCLPIILTMVSVVPKKEVCENTANVMHSLKVHCKSSQVYNLQTIKILWKFPHFTDRKRILSKSASWRRKPTRNPWTIKDKGMC